jgi:hypothetical protein
MLNKLEKKSQFAVVMACVKFGLDFDGDVGQAAFGLKGSY